MPNVKDESTASQGTSTVIESPAPTLRVGRRRPRGLRLPTFLRTPSGAIGAALLLVVFAIALLGPAVAPYTLSEPVGIPGSGPGQGALLGTDGLGRDVLSRVLSGGRSVIGLASLATALAFAVGMIIGLIAGYSRSLIDPLLMRTVDVALAFPAILILLLLAGGLGSSTFVVILGVVLVEAPAISRLIRTATLEISTRGYVEAAEARGDGTFRVLMRQILPNVTPVALAALGAFFGYSVVLIASMNFLGLGLKVPAADWGLMMAENRGVLALNPASVLAPALALAVLTISLNLVADAYTRAQGVGTRSDRRRGRSALPLLGATGAGEAGVSPISSATDDEDRRP